MSYIITMLTESGIAMAADRQICQFPNRENIMGNMPLPESLSHMNEFLTKNVQELCDNVYEKNKRFYKVLTKTARKLFTVNDNIAFSTGQQLHTKEFFPVELLADYFCRTNTFEKPGDVAKSLFDFMCTRDESMDLVIHLAGFDKSKEHFEPEFHELHIGNKQCICRGSTGIMYAGANSYFQPYISKIGEQILFYNVQDAIRICSLAVDMSRELGKYIDLTETISEEYEVLAITLDGIQWIKKSKLGA